jgi:hypothetical protein
MSLKSGLVTFCFVGVAAYISGIVYAQSDDPNSGLSLGQDNAVKVVYAVYGGIAHAETEYVDVTDKVSDLFKKSPAGFFVSEQVILGLAGSKEFHSLIVFYNYDGKSHIFSMPENGGTLTLDMLKQAARDYPSHENEVPAPGTPDNDFRVVFATYGVSDGGAQPFMNVTALVRSLIRDQPEGFFAHEDVMGGDPHPGDQKALVIVFDTETGRHFYAQVNNGPLVSKRVLVDSAK